MFSEVAYADLLYYTAVWIVVLNDDVLYHLCRFAIEISSLVLHDDVVCADMP